MVHRFPHSRALTMLLLASLGVRFRPFLPSQRVTADLEMEKARLGELQQLDVISKAISYSKNRRSEAEVRLTLPFLPILPCATNRNMPREVHLDGWIPGCAHALGDSVLA